MGGGAFFQADEPFPKDVIGLKNSSAVFTPEEDKGGTRERPEKEVEVTDEVELDTMGVGKNTTSKSMDGGSEGKFEEENKHSADFYPVSVHDSFIVFLMATSFIRRKSAQSS